jgi:alpha-1,4-digalacturonate transport system substrate-binding protein
MRRSMFAGVATLALAAALAGCSPGSGSSNNTQNGSANEPKNLTYLYFTDGPDEQATRSLIAKFAKSTGAKVDLQIIPYADLQQQLQARLAGGNAPDVVRLTDLTPFRDDLLDLKAAGQDIGGQFLDAARNNITGKNGELLGVPSDLTMNGPFVNVDQFKKAGVSLPDPQHPWTWSQLVAQAKQVQAANGTPYAIAYDKSGHRFAGMLSQFGTNYFGTDGKVWLDDAKATAAVTLFTDLTKQDTMSKDFWLSSGSKYKGANEIFLAQAAPVYVSGNWQVSQFAKNAKFTWAAVPNACQERCGGFPGGKFMAGLKVTKSPKLAAQFVAFMNTAQSQTEFCQTSLFLPTRKDLIDKGITYPQRSDDMAVFLSDIKRTPVDTYASAYSPAFGGTATAVVNEISKVIAGQETAAAAVTNIRAAAEKNLQSATK